MTEKCSVLQCEAVPGTGKYFYKFPVDFDMCLLWIHNMGDDALLQEFQYGGACPLIQRHVCSDHFSDTDFAIFGNRESGLRDDAIPLCATIKSDPDSSESPVENEETLLELVAVKTEETFNSTKTEVEKLQMTLAEKQAYRRRLETLDQRTIRLEKNRLRVMAWRQAETEAESMKRREKNRLRVMAKRQEETEAERRKRRQKCAQRASKVRASETEEQRQQRLEDSRLRTAERRKNMTPEEREIWRLKNRIQTRERRQNEDEIKKMLRRHNNAICAYLKRSQETEDERMERRMKDALRAAERRKMETPEEREERLRKDRERVKLIRMEKRIGGTPTEKKTTRRNCSKYSHRTRIMLSILKSVQEHLNHNQIKKEHITSENLTSLMIFVKSCHPDLKEAYIEDAVHTFLSRRDSDSPGKGFANDDASLLSMSDSSQSGSIFSGVGSSYCESFEAITEEIEIKQEPLLEL